MSASVLAFQKRILVHVGQCGWKRHVVDPTDHAKLPERCSNVRFWSLHRQSMLPRCEYVTTAFGSSRGDRSSSDCSHQSILDASCTLVLCRLRSCSPRVKRLNFARRSRPLCCVVANTKFSNFTKCFLKSLTSAFKTRRYAIFWRNG